MLAPVPPAPMSLPLPLLLRLPLPSQLAVLVPLAVPVPMPLLGALGRRGRGSGGAFMPLFCGTVVVLPGARRSGTGFVSRVFFIAGVAREAQDSRVSLMGKTVPSFWRCRQATKNDLKGRSCQYDWDETCCITDIVVLARKDPPRWWSALSPQVKKCRFSWRIID